MIRRRSADPVLHPHAVYDTVVFLLESVVFSLIGLHLPALIRAVGDRSLVWIAQAAAITVTLSAVRVVWVFPLSLIMQERRAGGGPGGYPLWCPGAGARGVLRPAGHGPGPR